MPHPHQSALDEFQFAIRHFVPTLPKEIKEEAQQLHDQLASQQDVDEDALRRAFYEVGVKEYPYRKAYEELTHSTAEAQMKAMVLEHVDEAVRAVIKPHLDAGVSLEELVASDIFESELDAKQRYQIEDGILVAANKLAEKLTVEVGGQTDMYHKLVEKWQAHAAEIEKAIQELEALSQGGEENQQAEIKDKAVRFREGFLVTEPDPQLDEVKKEVEYWRDTFAQET
ncbi:hypothetical protein HY631_03520 [Candidatus Uhrbacteria bacterium]|nr:hypothetical protein [Candidatus Uhrbacteria bacterium]